MPVIPGQDEHSEFAEPGIQFCGFTGLDPNTPEAGVRGMAR